MTVLEESNIFIPLVTISYLRALITFLTSVERFRLLVFLVYLSN